MLETPMCPYCGRVVKLVKASAIYRGPTGVRLEKLRRLFWACHSCDAYVGCHPDSKRPLGTLANEVLREARKATHAEFDPLWRNHATRTRSEAYAWLGRELGIAFEDRHRDNHIAMFDVERCKQAIKYCMLKGQEDEYKANQKVKEGQETPTGN